MKVRISMIGMMIPRIHSTFKSAREFSYGSAIDDDSLHPFESNPMGLLSKECSEASSMAMQQHDR